ncbi:MAG: LamG domain-containing protein [Alphaproteobacteria bacterium]|nr:LamG domain-containing protein [Alphaproteobacteria bacterium]
MPLLFSSPSVLFSRVPSLPRRTVTAAAVVAGLAVAGQAGDAAAFYKCSFDGDLVAYYAFDLSDRPGRDFSDTVLPANDDLGFDGDVDGTIMRRGGRPSFPHIDLGHLAVANAGDPYLDARLDLQSIDDFQNQGTIAAWVRIDAATDSIQPVVTIGRQIGLGLRAGQARIVPFGFYNGVGRGINVVGTQGVPESHWVHIAFTFRALGDGTRAETRGQVLYINGFPLAGGKFEQQTALDLDDRSLFVGPVPGLTNFEQSFDGAIDEVRLYRRALAWPDIRKLYGGCIDG